MDTLYTKMQQVALQNAQKCAIVFYGKRYTFNQVLSFVNNAAFGLKQYGVKQGDVVTLCMPNTPSAQIAFYALNKLGAIVSLVHPFSSSSQLNASMEETKSSLLIAYDLFLSQKGKQIASKAKILKSRSDYFMSPVAKLYFKFVNRKAAKFDCDLFEDFLLGSSDDFTAYSFKQNQPAVFLPSGGTTNSPKTIMHSCNVFNKLCAQASHFLSNPLSSYKAMYSVLPIFHGFGLCMNMHMCATIGVTNVMSIKFNPKSMLKSIKKEQVNVITGVPAMYEKLLNCAYFKKANLTSLMDCFVGGDSASKKLILDFDHALSQKGSKAKLFEGYGLTETVTVCTVNCKSFNKTGSVGYPLPEAKIKIFGENGFLNANQIGEICVSTPLFMLGYFTMQSDEENKEESDFNQSETKIIKNDLNALIDDNQTENPFKQIYGEKWLFTGDLGYVDEDGFLFFKQRIKNMMKISGIPIFPSEIEQAAEQVDGVIRSAAIMVEEQGKQQIKLFVESKRIDHQKLKQEIFEICALRLLPYAVPKIIEVKQSLPLNIIGKIDRKKL